MNVLGMALSVLPKTSVDYYQFSGRDTNAAGIDVTTYLDAVTINSGKVTAVNKNNYANLGLDFSKNYIKWYVPNLAAVDLARDSSGDVIEVIGRRWELVGSNIWLGLDGWNAYLAVDIGPVTGAITTGALTMEEVLQVVDPLQMLDNNA